MAFLNNKEEFKYKHLLAMVYITFLMAATIMAYKIVDIKGFCEPGSTLIYTFTFFLGNVYTELYGHSYAKKLIWESIFCGYLFALLIVIVNSLPSPDFWDKHEQYEHVVGHILRFTNAGVIGYLISFHLNSLLITKWKYKLKGRLFWVRSLAATTISEVVATFCAGLITFFGMLPTSNILAIMTNAFLFKVVYGLIAVWPATFLAFILKKNEIGADSISCINYAVIAD
jgi:uncharacterized integral membrane protein (TIGR00697 family)